jgi:hypothetical protein
VAQTYATDEAVELRKRSHHTRNRWIVAAIAVLGVFVVALAITAEYIVHHAGPLLRSSVVATLSDRFHSPVELDSLDISVLNGLQVRGTGLRILYLAGPTLPDIAQKQGLPAPPMLSVNTFAFRTTLDDLLHLRANLARVDVDGMELHIPPHDKNHVLHSRQPTSRIAITVATIYCKNVKLVIETAVPGKEPLQFTIRNLELTDIGPSQPMQYVADVINPKPVGDVHANGHFGPWQGDDPRSTRLDGHYTFQHVDLSSIKGLRGTLSSTGQFTGLLSQLSVDGTTSTPDFALDISSHPLPNNTTFHALVDGTTGDTTLNPVQATLGRSSFTCTGTIVRVPGKGHDIALNVNMPHGHIEDILQLVMKSAAPVMRGAVAVHAKLHLPPGQVRVARKLQLSGNLHMQDVEFTSPKLQDQVNALSLRAQGKPGDLKAVVPNPGSEVSSDMAATFALANATLLLHSLDYQVPGAKVNLDGVYPLDGSAFEFRGHVRTAATASQMLTGWKSFLLKPFDGLLRKNGAGAEVPIRITGSNGDFKVGFAMHGADETPQQIEAELHARREMARQ